jgi:ATP-dependent DNA ligase
VDSRDQVRWLSDLIVIDHGQVRAFTRNGNDWTAAYRRVGDACSRLVCKTAVLDGEIAVQDDKGLTDFDALRTTSVLSALVVRPLPADTKD